MTQKNQNNMEYNLSERSEWPLIFAIEREGKIPEGVLGSIEKTSHEYYCITYFCIGRRNSGSLPSTKGSLVPKLTELAGRKNFTRDGMRIEIRKI